MPVETTSKVDEHVIVECRARYDVGPRFAEQYLAFWAEERGKMPRSLAETLSGPDPEPMWFDYAMSTNSRARQIVEQCRPHIPPAGGRYLDVGCGFGGCLVAFAQRGLEVCGIEIDPPRLALGRANCADHGLGDCIHDLSILDEQIVARLGRFDLITCLDVIEHVDDAAQTLVNLSDLLEPGGTLVLKIPNKDSVAFVASDGHFNLFGITQLPRPLATRYHERLIGGPYDVGEYYPREFYEDRLRALGLHVTSGISPQNPIRVPDGILPPLRELAAGYRAWRRQTAGRLPLALRWRLRARVARYAASLAYNAARHAAGRLPTEDYDLRFRADFWLLTARKPGRGPAEKELE